MKALLLVTVTRSGCMTQIGGTPAYLNACIPDVSCTYDTPVLGTPRHLAPYTPPAPTLFQSPIIAWPSGRQIAQSLAIAAGVAMVVTLAAYAAHLAQEDPAELSTGLPAVAPPVPTLAPIVRVITTAPRAPTSVPSPPTSTPLAPAPPPRLTSPPPPFVLPSVWPTIPIPGLRPPPRPDDTGVPADPQTSRRKRPPIKLPRLQ